MTFTTNATAYVTMQEMYSQKVQGKTVITNVIDLFGFSNNNPKTTKTQLQQQLSPKMETKLVMYSMYNTKTKAHRQIPKLSMISFAI